MHSSDEKTEENIRCGLVEESKTTGSVEMTLMGQNILFPKDPYQCQLDLMKTVIVALVNR